jgi:hypothetical protein
MLHIFALAENMFAKLLAAIRRLNGWLGGIFFAPPSQGAIATDFIQYYGDTP